ncbi:MAG: (2Fe-2S) ferredoxin domain-containing protein [Candidatus Aminicenantes bacterium]|nr:(2Fe-2S) ferredoxin domain-containing protein [Candidatus Aminicenantes bacterium]
MPKLTIEELAKMRDRTRRTMVPREGGEFRAKVNVHMGTCGIAAGARGVMTALLEEVEKRGLQDVLLTSSGCAGLCSREPMITVEIAGRAPVKYVNLDPAKAREVLDKHVLRGTVVREHALGVGSEKTDV